MTFAPGASAPDCSTSRSVSPLPEASLGAPGPPSTLVTVTDRPLAGTWATFSQKYRGASGSSAARVTMASVCPAPVVQRVEPVVGREIGREMAGLGQAGQGHAAVRAACLRLDRAGVGPDRVAGERGVVGHPGNGLDKICEPGR